MKPPKFKWPDTEFARRGLYFAQTAKLLLDERAYESFRLQSLDTIARLQEIEDISQDIRHRGVSHRNIILPCEELAETLKSDHSALSIIGPNSSQYIEYFFKIDDGKAKQHENLARTADFLRKSLLPYYRVRLENDIINLLSAQNFFSECHAITQRYLAFIVNSGFSKAFLKQTINTHFFGHQIKRFDARRVKRFYRALSESNIDYEVWLPVYKSTSRVFSNLGEGAYRLEQLPDQLRQLIQSKAQYSENDLYLRTEQNARDPFRAVNSARFVPRILYSISVLQDRSIELNLRNYAFVRQIGSKKIDECEISNVTLQDVRHHTSPSYTRLIRDYAVTALEKFDRTSFDRILSSSENVSLSREGASPENQLITIWSAIEVLFGDPPDEGNRISFYRDSLVPCITINYPWRYTTAVYTEISKTYRTLIKSHCDTAAIDKSLEPATRFRYLIFDDNLSSERNILIKNLHSNPCAQEIITNMIDKFGDIGSLEATIKEHEKRVRWQISRIYRARNQFIHGGSSPSYVNSLSRNAFEYYRTALQSIILEAEKFSGTGSVDMFIHAIENANNARRKSLEKIKKASGPSSSAKMVEFLQRV